MPKIRENLIQGFFLFLILAFCLPSRLVAGESVDQKKIRIAILQNVDQVEISVRGKYEIQDPATAYIYKVGRNFPKTKVTLGKKGIRLGDETLNVARLRFVPEQDVTLRTKKQDRRYRGVVDIIRTKDNHLLAVNVIELEDYIRGVLYHEISPRWPMDAIMAQAIPPPPYSPF